MALLNPPPNTRPENKLHVVRHSKLVALAESHALHVSIVGGDYPSLRDLQQAYKGSLEMKQKQAAPVPNTIEKQAATVPDTFEKQAATVPNTIEELLRLLDDNDTQGLGDMPPLTAEKGCTSTAVSIPCTVEKKTEGEAGSSEPVKSAQDAEVAEERRKFGLHELLKFVDECKEPLPDRVPEGKDAFCND